MILQEIKNILNEKVSADFEEICFHLKQDKEIVKHALNLLVDKDTVSVEELKNPCAGCTCGGLCSEHSKFLYRIKKNNQIVRFI